MKNRGYQPTPSNASFATAPARACWPEACRIGAAGLLLALTLPLAALRAHAADECVRPGGTLDAVDETGAPLGPVPLQHTDVEARISGHFSRVTVVQHYQNPYEKKIEAVYTFPLSHRAAVDRMTMTLGDRVVQGEVKARSKARRVYELARRQGHVASLLEQERPNIFTQSVANIEPGAKVRIEISYVEIVESVDGEHRFAFPMVVAPRYTPGRPLRMDESGGETPGLLPEPGHPFTAPTDQAPDADRVTPMPVRPGQRAGHDIALRVFLDSGGPAIATVFSPSHEIVRDSDGETSSARVRVALAEADSIPNRDFLLRWRLQREKIEEAFLTHTGRYGDREGGFFTLILQPPERVADADARPRELIFVLDNSGSMRGARAGGVSALAAAKNVINLALDTMRPDDRFNVVSFNNTLDTLWTRPRPNTRKHRQSAQRYVDSRQGGGGTEMRNAALHALQAGPYRPNPDERLAGEDEDRMRIVLFVTDGLVSNDDAIVAAIREHAHETRVFTIGMSRAPNRHLLDEMARVGRGAADYVLPDDDLEPIVQRFANRIATPVLTDIELEFDEGLALADVLPSARQMPDLFDWAPLAVHGRFLAAGTGVLRLRGRTGAGAYERVIEVEFPENEPRHDLLATLWAREQVGALLRAGQNEVEAIVRLGETFQIMTPHTSFVAVERRRVTLEGEPVLVRVPVEFPLDMSWEGIFGRSMPADVSDDEIVRQIHAAPQLGRHVDSVGPLPERHEFAGRPAVASPVPAPGRGGPYPNVRPGTDGALGSGIGRPAAPPVSSGSRLRRVYMEESDARQGAAAPLPSGPRRVGDGLHLLTLRLPSDQGAETVASLRQRLHDRDEPDRALVRVVHDEARGRVHLLVAEAILAAFEPYAARLDPSATLAQSEVRAIYAEWLAALDRQVAELRRTVDLERRLEDSLRARTEDAPQTLLVSVRLAALSPESVAALERIGLTHVTTVASASFVVGWIPASRLEALALSEGVRRVEPADRKSRRGALAAF